ncbi:SDR family oxidoreductase [Roseospirillum parvum]|uniref:NAD(P)-dependent dehydrogenase, short-chain alcohol dehydrogenase family n=1 Tax=Roseospirillum parvum TaxID=83401 RepID=A0A1G7WK90_9PROT|nr:SDR family oxidoreductase [Roseospirillum parvum]SDG72269.1 NAD(P)-dependent dehydrogenase, short-chain alcohol dehydrogenase family [Roseospirillum parvum]
MPTVLIIGANRGLGLEFARQYRKENWQVVATCRDPEAAGDLKAVAHEVLGLDVADPDSIAAFVKALAAPSLDVVIHNAGIYGPKGSGTGFGEVDPEAWAPVFRTNAMGPLLVTQALAEAGRLGVPCRLAVLTSKMGSIGDNTSGGNYIYRSSKAAANAVTRSMAHDLKGRGVTCVALHPGWVRTDMGGPHGLIDAPESVAGMMAVLDQLEPGDAGKFLSYDGSEIPW